MYITEPFCHFCFWNKPFEIFNDSNYSPPKKTLVSSCSYNPVINPNGVSNVPVCYFCLITNIYNCDTSLKSSCVSELKSLFLSRSATKIQLWWLNYIYDISKPMGKKFVLSKLSINTKEYFAC